MRQDTRFLSTSIIGTLALFGGEGYVFSSSSCHFSPSFTLFIHLHADPLLNRYVAEAYLQTDAGKASQKRAKEEGSELYTHSKNIILRPGVLGGLVGVFNVGILGGVGYWSYINWDRPYAWDRRQVSAVGIAIATLFAGEG